MCIGTVVTLLKPHQREEAWSESMEIGRRPLAHAFSDTALSKSEHYVSYNVQNVCDHLVLKDAKT